MRRTVTALLVALAAAAAPILAQDQIAATVPDVPETLQLELLRTDRMTVPVSVDGRGPYAFIVDTGSERTVIARELAAHLGLGAGTTATVHSMTEVSRIATVVIPALEVGRRTVSDIHAPALARNHLGAEGLLGVDSLRSQRVELDFVRRQMTVVPSRSPQPRWDDDAIVITARNRFGHLDPGRCLVRRRTGLGDHRHRRASDRRQYCAAPTAGTPRPARVRCFRWN